MIGSLGSSVMYSLLSKPAGALSGAVASACLMVSPEMNGNMIYALLWDIPSGAWFKRTTQSKV